MVVKDNQIPAWASPWCELPPTELFDQFKKVLLVITSDPNLLAEDFNMILAAIRDRLPDAALFLYTVSDGKSLNNTSEKRL